MKKAILILFLVILTCYPILPVDVLENVYAGKVFLLDEEGYIFTDYGPHSIAKYSPGGKFLILMGRKGEGPGDFKRLGWFSINPVDNIIYATEFVNGNRWISKFSKDGKYLGEWRFDLDWTKYQGLSTIHFDTGGNVYIQAEKTHSVRHKDVTLGIVEKSILKFSPQGKQLKEIYKINIDFFVAKDGKGNLTIPFHNYLGWLIYGDKIIIRESYDEFIRVFSLDGTFEKKISLPFKRQKVTDEDIEEWEEWLKTYPEVKRSIAEGVLDLKYLKKRMPFPEFKPVSGSQPYIDTHGNLYSGKAGGFNPKESIWARVNLEDGTSSVVKFKPGEKFIGVWNNTFLFSKSVGYETNILKVDEKELFKSQ